MGFTTSPHPPNILRNETPFADATREVASAIHRVGLVETPQGEAGLFVVRLHEWGLRSADRDRWRRRIAKAFIHHFPGNRPLIALIPPEDVWKKSPTQRDVEFVIPKVRAKGDVTTVRALVNAAEPSGFHVRLLQDIQLASGMDLSAISRHWAEAFSVERVTTNFYKEFEQLRDRLVDVIQKRNMKHPLLGGTDNLAEVNRFATRQLGRILFVWFLQSKHWLDDDEQFLSNLYEQQCRKGKKNYFNDILLPLFFQALALPKSARPDNANTLLGAIPYLNGGLFMPTDFEDKLPIALFVDETKIRQPFKRGHCFLVFDGEEPYAEAAKTIPMAVCVGCESRESRRDISDRLGAFGLNRFNPEEDYAGSFPLIARNEKFDSFTGRIDG